MQKSINIFQFIPNFITSLNLLAGSISIVMAFEGYLLFASYLIGIAAIFDFLDGMAARLLNAYTKIGKELDSLADIVSFGVAPSVIIYHLLKLSIDIKSFTLIFNSTSLINIILLFSSFLIAIFSALRLAKFNIDSRQTDSFIGLPTPANAIFIASLPLVLYHNENVVLDNIILSIYFLFPLIIIQSFLLVAEFPMFSLKFKDFRFNNNKIRYIFLGISVVLLILLQYIAIPIIIILYIILSALNNWVFN